MLRFAVGYVLATVSIALGGMLLALTGAIIAQGDSKRAGLAIVGGATVVFSPAISALWFWFRRRRVRKQNRLLAQEERKKDFLRRRFIERQRIIDAVDRHRTAISRNLHRAIQRNDYGALVADTTDEALREFFASINLDESLIAAGEAADLVFEQVDFRRSEDRQAGFDPMNIPFDGHSFEQWVAEALVTYGWEAELTKASGDQGIDVIASKNGKRLGLQCKLYSTAIGNKAIQEAHAGKVYYQLDAAAVMTNAGFTSSAKDLAVVTGVGLFSHHDIPSLYEKVFG